MSSDNTDGDSSGRRRFLKYAGAAGAVALAGCSGGNGGSGGDGTTTDGDSTTTAAGSVQTGGKLTVATQADIGKLDPHLSQAAASLNVLNNVYQKPVRIDADLKPAKQLAKSWSVSDDGLTWTVELQQGVQFHAPVSREMTAADVAYSIQRIKAEETASPWASNFTPVKSVSADGDYTVVFEFDKPYAPFLVKLTKGFVMPEGAGEASEYDISEQPVGTGPFTFEETVAQTRTTLKKFGDYWETDDEGNALPYLDTLEFKPMPEGNSRVTAVQTGEVDLVTSVPRSQANSLKGASGVTFSAKPGTFYDYVGQNTNAAPLDDVKLRQAISWCVDRQAVAQGARFGYATPTQTPVPPESVWKDLITVDEPYSQNIEKAKQLVEESKYDGETLEIQVGQEYGGQVDEAQIVAAQMKEAGINVEVKPLEFGTMISNLNSGNFQLTVLGWVGFVDPDDMFYVEFHTGENFNQTNYSNEQVDTLLEQGRHATGSREERAQYYDKAMDIIANESPYTFLVFNQEVAAWQKTVNGFVHNPTGTPWFTSVWKGQ